MSIGDYRKSRESGVNESGASVKIGKPLLELAELHLVTRLGE
jgi:hypothetical protein